MLGKLYSRLRGRYGKLYERRTGFVLSSIRASSNLLILGAREAFVRRIIDHTGGDLDYCFVDRVPVECPGKKLDYRDADLNEMIPFEDSTFECVVADQLIEHLVRPDTFLREVHRVTQSGGRVLLGSENLAAWHNIFALLLGYHPFSDHYSEFFRVGNPLSIHHLEPIADPLQRHAKLPTVRAVEDLLRLYGFVIEEVRGFGHLLPLGNLLDPYHSFQFVFVARVDKR